MSKMTTQEPVENPNAPTRQEVLSVRHWTEHLFSFTLARPPSFRFRSGEFVMLGLEVEGKPVLRAYSMASPSWDEELEFFSIKVADGRLTSRLQKIQPGDHVLLGRKPTGTLVHDALTPGKRLYLFSTGTGFAPFASIIRDLDTYDKFEQVIVTHTCRDAADLAYSRSVVDHTLNHEYLGPLCAGKLFYYDSITRGAFHRVGRVTDLIRSGRIFSELNVSPLDPQTDRAMVCGSVNFNTEMKTLIESFGLTEGANSAPAEYVVEKAFVG
ncbi:MAG: ferredoxin--NADP reductase [Alphaproteobacteria bacterium]